LEKSARESGQGFIHGRLLRESTMQLSFMHFALFLPVLIFKTQFVKSAV
jgi:hypothetical protein